MTRLYLSRIFINPVNRRAMRDLLSPYEMHRTVMSAFPDMFDGRVLFRSESSGGKPFSLLYVQSDHEADWSFLHELGGYLAQSVDGQMNPAQRAFRPELKSGHRFIFRLYANPTVKRNGKRQALYRVEDQLRWLGRKLETAGARLLDVRQPSGERRRFRGNDGRQLVMLGVKFNGLLEVFSPDLLTGALADGIGSGKGFGFGLLSLART